MEPVTAPRVQMNGADLLRVIAVFAVLYSHISFYLIDDIGGGWWVIDVVNTVLIEDAGLNLHLSFVGVSMFMLLTGLLITRSAMRHSRRDFMVARLARLVPALWFAVALAVILVKLGLNGMFSGQPGITNGEAVLSFSSVVSFSDPKSPSSASPGRSSCKSCSTCTASPCAGRCVPDPSWCRWSELHCALWSSSTTSTCRSPTQSRS